MFRIDLASLKPVGQHLRRPECVLAVRSGSICASDWNGGVSIIDRSGGQRLIRAHNAPRHLRPNGIALLADGSFLLAQLGERDGGLYRLYPNGRCEPYLTKLDGLPLPPSNYPHVDYHGRIWLSVSTRHVPRAAAYRADVQDGFIVLINNNDARIVADDLGYTNECCVHPSGNELYVNETFARRLTAFEIKSNGDLCNKRTITEFGYGTYPDGLTFDSEGGVWITSVVSNRIVRVSPKGEQHIVLEDMDRDHVRQVEQAFQQGQMGRPHLDQVCSLRLKNISSLAFGGADLKTAYLGCLLGDAVMSFTSPVRGWPPVHWNYLL